jgi:hypothetical protein
MISQHTFNLFSEYPIDDVLDCLRTLVERDYLLKNPGKRMGDDQTLTEMMTQLDKVIELAGKVERGGSPDWKLC